MDAELFTSYCLVPKWSRKSKRKNERKTSPFADKNGFIETLQKFLLYDSMYIYHQQCRRKVYEPNEEGEEPF